jgi:ABC-2 type transport system ATP-binding protein
MMRVHEMGTRKIARPGVSDSGPSSLPWHLLMNTPPTSSTDNDEGQPGRSPSGHPAEDAVVTVTGLNTLYGAIVAVENLTFSLKRGTVTGFLGPNGAGKTTTLRLLLGLAEPTSGAALVFGRRYAQLDEPSQLVGAVLESGDFHPGRSGRDHLRVLAVAAGIAPDRVEMVLDVVGIGSVASRAVRSYSLGMRQQLGLAGALLGDPQLLLLDEPANGLDRAGVPWPRTVLRAFADGGGTVLVSSHLLAELAQSVEHVVIIDRGRLVADAPLDEIARHGQTLEDAYLALTTEVAS